MSKTKESFDRVKKAATLAAEALRYYRDHAAMEYEMRVAAEQRVEQLTAELADARKTMMSLATFMFHNMTKRGKELARKQVGNG